MCCVIFSSCFQKKQEHIDCYSTVCINVIALGFNKVLFCIVLCRISRFDSVPVSRFFPKIICYKAYNALLTPPHPSLPYNIPWHVCTWPTDMSVHDPLSVIRICDMLGILWDLFLSLLDWSFNDRCFRAYRLALHVCKEDHLKHLIIPVQLDVLEVKDMQWHFKAIQLYSEPR